MGATAASPTQTAPLPVTQMATSQPNKVKEISKAIKTGIDSGKFDAAAVKAMYDQLPENVRNQFRTKLVDRIAKRSALIEKQSAVDKGPVGLNPDRKAKILARVDVLSQVAGMISDQAGIAATSTLRTKMSQLPTAQKTELSPG